MKDSDWTNHLSNRPAAGVMLFMHRTVRPIIDQLYEGADVAAHDSKTREASTAFRPTLHGKLSMMIT